MNKKIIYETILQRSKHVNKYTETKPFTWREIKQILEDEKLCLLEDDILEVGYQEGYYEEDLARDASIDLKIIRPREETDEEFNRRKSTIDRYKEQDKIRRKQEYLKLKEEFENEQEV